MIRHLKRGQTAEVKAENTLQVRNTVEAILGDIGAHGEKAVRQYSEKFDHWSPASFRLTEREIADCLGAESSAKRYRSGDPARCGAGSQKSSGE